VEGVRDDAPEPDDEPEDPEPEDPEPEDDPDALDPSPAGVAAGPDSVAAGLVSDSAALLRAALRSFFAQPDPLKWTAGAATALRTGPPWQTGQVVGPSACTPWITSNRCPQW
jgi:hypothetical protein